MHWLREYGESDRRLETAALTTFMLLAMLYYIVTSGVAEVSHTQSQIAGSLYLPNILLALFRTVAAVLALFTLVSICIDEQGSVSLPVFYDSRESGEIVLLGAHRLIPFTVWSFAAFGLYFTIAAASSWVLVLGGEVPDWALASAPLAFATACGTALLVTVVVTFYLIPSNAAKGYDVSKYFEWQEVLMHNGNVIILGIELVFGGIGITLGMVAFPLLFGIVYIGFANAYAMFGGGIYLYDFLDPRLKGGPIIHFILFLIIFGFYCFTLMLNALTEWNVIAGFLAVALGIYSILRVRIPSEFRNQPA
ncbi:MAG: hypothetical protein ACJ0HO_02875 [Candidatus Thalassarchaeum sp.]|tara:strand:+ start:21 stop:941 length:921 start_codon:yes stop_codon:yes gene_type:complete